MARVHLYTISAMALAMTVAFIQFREGLEAFDNLIIQHLAPLRWPLLDGILRSALQADITRMAVGEDPVGSSAFWLLVAAVVGYRRGWRWLVLSTAALAASQLTAHILKPLIARPRRLDDVALLLRVPEFDSDPSFPSGHAQKSFALAVILGGAWPSLKPVWYLLACVVAVERFYVGAHYPTDIVSGALNGLAIGLWTLQPWFVSGIEGVRGRLARAMSRVRRMQSGI